jgi:acyl-CoA reductase-like NAD-dependent aldehyde dehydrogenase
VGGERVGSPRLTNTSPSMKVDREEIFGPVVCAIPFDDPSQILPAANDNCHARGV